MSLDHLSAEVRAEVERTRAVVAALHAELPRWGLVVWTAGNVSQRVRVPGGDDLLVIKPSGVTYDELTPEAMVVCDLEGNLLEGTRAPSSDTLWVPPWRRSSRPTGWTPGGWPWSHRAPTC